MTRMTDEELVAKFQQCWERPGLTATQRARFDAELWARARGDRPMWRARVAMVVAVALLAVAAWSVWPLGEKSVDEATKVATVATAVTVATAETATNDDDWDEWLGLAAPAKWGDVPEDLPVEYQALAYWLGPSEQEL